jgi:hypothetical protein
VNKPGGVVAAGGQPDRQSESLFLAVKAAPAGSQGERTARCKGQFNCKEMNGRYKKTARRVEVLRELYTIWPKLRAKEM